MECVHTLEANQYAYNLSLADKLEEQKQAYINDEAERILNDKYSNDYQDIITSMADYADNDNLIKYDKLVKKIITADGERLIKFKNQLRELIKQVACDYVEERMNNLRGR